MMKTKQEMKRYAFFGILVIFIFHCRKKKHRRWLRGMYQMIHSLIKYCFLRKVKYKREEFLYNDGEASIILWPEGQEEIEESKEVSCRYDQCSMSPIYKINAFEAATFQIF